MPCKSVVKYLLIGCLFLIIGILALFQALPPIVESQIKSRLPLAVQALSPDFSIETIGVTRTILRNIRLGEDLTIDLAEIRYQWRGGRDFKIKRVGISGLSLGLGLDESSRISFNDMAFPGQDETDRSEKKTRAVAWQDLAEFFPLVPGQIRMRNSDITLMGKSGTLRIPIDLEITLDTDLGQGKIALELTPLGQSIDLNAALDLKAAMETGLKTALLRLTAGAEKFDPASLALLFPGIFQDFRLTGPLDLKIEGQGQKPWQFNLAGGIAGIGSLPRIRLVQCRGTVDGFHLEGAGDLGIQGDGLADIGLDFGITGDFDPGRDMGFTLSVNNHEMDVLNLDLNRAHWIPKISAMPKKISISRPRFSLELRGTRAQQDCRLTFGGESLGADYGDGDLGVKDLSLRAGVTRREAGLFPIESGELEFKAKALASQLNGAGLTSSGVTIRAGIKPDQKNQHLSLDLDAALDGVRAALDGAHLNMDRAGVSGALLLDQSTPPMALLVAKVKNAGLDIRDPNVSAMGMDIHLPYTYPFRPDTRPGTIEIKALTYDRRIKAGLSGSLGQIRDMGVALKGKIASHEIPDLIIDLAMEAGADTETFTPWADITLASRHFVMTTGDIARLMPGTQIPGNFRMDLSSEARIALKNFTLDTRGSIQIHDGSLDFPDLDLKVLGISGRIEFQDLLVPESLPGQALFVKSVTAGQFRFDEGVFRFSVEDGESLNLENMRFKWCNGLVSTESLRLPAADDKISLTLFCDRLEMDSLLRQLGAFDAQGGGTLNGRIPVVYNKGEISFDNGFLFSTPGQGGRVFVKDLDRMLDGFPKGTPEFSQLDLAGEALKDFQYDWAKLRMNTRGDTLDVKMELDGKPGRILPFEYSKEMNSFIRVDASSPGSKFQGVKLDVNLKLPFNRVMKFGNKLKNILD